MPYNKIFRKLRKDFMDLARQDVRTPDENFYMDRIRSLVPGLPKGQYTVNEHYMGSTHSTPYIIVEIMYYENCDTHVYDPTYPLVYFTFNKQNDGMWYPTRSYGNQNYSEMICTWVGGGIMQRASTTEVAILHRNQHPMYPARVTLVRKNGKLVHDPALDMYDDLEFNSKAEMLHYRSMPKALKQFEYTMRTGEQC